MGEGGVREKSLLEELQDLNIEDNIKERLVGKYWDEMEKYREDIKTFVKCFQSEKVRNYINETFKGGFVPVF